MRMAKVAIALHCSGSLVEYAIVSPFSQMSIYVETSFDYVVLNQVLISQMAWTGKLVVNAGHLSAYYGGQSIEPLLSPATFMRWYFLLSFCASLFVSLFTASMSPELGWTLGLLYAVSVN